MASKLQYCTTELIIQYAKNIKKKKKPFPL